MKAYVREGCIGCGLCVETCPEVFQIGEDGVARGDFVHEGFESAAQDAREGCPVQVIDIKE